MIINKHILYLLREFIKEIKDVYKKQNCFDSYRYAIKPFKSGRSDKEYLESNKKERCKKYKKFDRFISYKKPKNICEE
jgi:hypothetical protein